jgi:hypothetical protein
MANDDLITVVAWRPEMPGPHFGIRSDYVEQCWTALLGPTSVLLLRTLEPLGSDRPTTVALPELAARIGVGTTVARRTLLRLKGFGALKILDDGAVALRVTLPALHDGQLRRVPAVLRALHERYLAEATAA